MGDTKRTVRVTRAVLARLRAAGGPRGGVFWGLGLVAAASVGACTEVRLHAFGQPGEYCGSTEECDQGLVCVDNACEVEDPVGVGEACADDPWCQEGLLCVDGFCL